jgi:hypothetical protein
LILLRSLVFILLGAALIAATLPSAVKTFVLPRSAPDQIVRIVFVAIRRIFTFRLRLARSYHERDQVMAFFAPISLLALVPVWLPSFSSVHPNRNTPGSPLPGLCWMQPPSPARCWTSPPTHKRTCASGPGIWLCGASPTSLTSPITRTHDMVTRSTSLVANLIKPVRKSSRRAFR